jgi:ABC-type protease/lipase transport system fused ATPase/permease subunit
MSHPQRQTQNAQRRALYRPSVLASVDKLLVLRDGAVEVFGPRNEIMTRVTRPVREVA